MTSLRRMLKILDLYDAENAIFDAEQICERHNLAPATAYRYLKELCDAGLLIRLPSGYTLGPRIIELDLQMREQDPLAAGSRHVMNELSENTGMSCLLSQLYGESVVSIYQVSRIDSFKFKYSRGRSMNLFQNATGRIVLAYLTPRKLRRVFDAHQDEPFIMQLNHDWKAFSRELRILRKQGYCITHGESDSGVSGIAAPLFDEQNRVLGSITLLSDYNRFQVFNQDYLADLIRQASKILSDQLASINHLSEPETGELYV